MTEHEPLCPWNGTSITFDGSPIGCQCALIRRVRIQMSEDGWVAPESHEAVGAVTKARSQLSAMTTMLFEQVEALPEFGHLGFVKRDMVLALIEEKGIYTRD